MKIIISIYDSLHNPYYSGGGARSTHEIAKRLAKKHWVSVIAGAYPGSQNEIIDHVHYKFIGFTFAGGKIGQIIFSLLLPYYVMTENYDVWLENFLPPHSTGFIPLFTQKPVIGITTILHAENFSQKYKIPFHLIEKVGIKKYKYAIVLNKALAQRIRKLNPTIKLEIIPIGVDKRLFQLKNTEGSYVLFIGRLDVFQKGIDLLLEAWNFFVATQKKYRLVLVGTGTKEQIKTVKKYIKEFGLKKSVQLFGQAEGSVKNQLLTKSLLGVSASRFESFGIVALEFLAAGKPFLSFDIEGFKWIPKQVSVKTKPYDTKAFAKKLSDLTDSVRVRKQYAKAARTFARKYDFDVIAGQYNSFIERVHRNV